MPVKTVIVPAGTSVNGHCLTVASASAEFTVRLKQPIEEQAEFLWLPYEVVDRDATVQTA
jgi:hypothetical protein